MRKVVNALIFLLLYANANSQVQCAIDVVINEGTLIEMCEEAPTTISASNGFVQYNWTGPQTLSGQAITPAFSGNYVVSALDASGCTSMDTIQVIIHPSPTPTILSSEGNPICAIPGGTTLSTASAYTSYDWGNSNTSPTFFTSGPGAYGVTVVDANGCTGHDVITITEVQFGISQQSVSGCFGNSTLLIASGGTSYFWSTTETNDSIVVSPTTDTQYTVTATNGACMETLTITVPAVDTSGFSLQDTIYMESGEVATLIGPPGFESYNWFPNDDLDSDSLSVTNLTASGTGPIYLEAVHPSGCIFRDTVIIIVLDLTIPNGFSPNGDPINEFFVIPELEYLRGALTVWNRWGDIVMESSDYQNDWDGTCRTMFCAGKGPLPEGTYFYFLEVQGITFEGYITLKR